MIKMDLEKYLRAFPVEKKSYLVEGRACTKVQKVRYTWQDRESVIRCVWRSVRKSL